LLATALLFDTTGFGAIYLGWASIGLSTLDTLAPTLVDPFAIVDEACFPTSVVAFLVPSLTADFEKALIPFYITNQAYIHSYIF